MKKRDLFAINEMNVKINKIDFFFSVETFRNPEMLFDGTQTDF